MQLNKIRLVIIAAAIGLIALVVCQVIWMQHSRHLIEEDFEQKVKMAICSAVDNWSKDHCTVNRTHHCSKPNQILDPEQIAQDTALHESLSNSLNYYGLNLKYEIKILDCESTELSNPYTCNLSPIISAGGQRLEISFPNKGNYIMKEMGLMLGAVILIIAFLAVVFLLLIYSLLRLRKMNQINKDFFNNMAHEFKTPLTNIGLASTMLQKRKQELRDNKFLSIVDRENAKLKNQVERVLHLARIENGHYHLQKEMLDINVLLSNAVDEMEMVIQKHNAIVKLKPINQPFYIQADPFHLSNAFRNLIENALLYSDKQPNLEIEIKPSKGGVQLLFSDNGIGIKKNEQQYIFDKFHRVGMGDLHQRKGFGLGLYYVKLVVELHKGFIKIVSEIDKGSRFNLFLPAVK